MPENHDQMNEFSIKFWTFGTGEVCKGFRAFDFFCSAAYITCAIRAHAPHFDPGRKHAFGVLFTENEKSNFPQRTELVLHQASFCSVLVITCASSRTSFYFLNNEKKIFHLKQKNISDWNQINNGYSHRTWVLLLLFQEKNPNGLMREDQMNESSVNFERLILGKFEKGSEHALVSLV